MIEKLLEQLPYEFLGKVKCVHLILVGVGVGLLFSAVYFFTLYQDSQEELARLKTKRTQIAQQLTNHKRLVAQKEFIAQTLARSTGRLDTLKGQLPRERDMPGLLKEISSFGSGRATFDITKFQLEGGKVSDFYKEIPVAITLRGSFWDTLDFLDKMQNRLQLVSFSNLKMDLQVDRKSGGKGEPAIVSHPVLTKIVANTYAYIEESEKKITQVAQAANNNAGSE
jgi:type IV pilus assembly protein PilO